MTHACKPELATVLEPYVLSDGATITGAHGLALLVKLPNGTQTGFRLFEEGTAEALAYELDNSYTANSEQYHSVGKMTLDLMTQYAINAQDVANYVQHNDLMGYIGAQYGQATASVGQLEAAMVRFQNA